MGSGFGLQGLGAGYKVQGPCLRRACKFRRSNVEPLELPGLEFRI